MSNVERALLLHTEEANHAPIFHVIAKPVLVIGTDIRNPNGDSAFVRESGEREMADLEIRCQIERDRDPYAYTTEYRNVFSADLVRAEAMVKTLRTVQRELQKMEREWGYCDSFGAYVTRVAKALKIDHFLWHLSGSGTMYAQNEYRHADVPDMQAWIANRIDEWQLAVVA